ncbi:SH3 domain-containing protein [Youngiibacter multivorans]|uniref:Uncharacterized protein YgiM (DUF1202 family) n=1 Tax=Youngiibacter multivorans TaxID=937251 RepID=A0ABS4G2Z6_9CLOT|nr:SH3 domain-containing protein [Youngiibacter multivorans]MBP1918901.1 uncharacterized protein YgiM (DUF1202 family) [Youngiibacter multivorans]
MNKVLANIGKVIAIGVIGAALIPATGAVRSTGAVDASFTAHSQITVEADWSGTTDDMGELILFKSEARKAGNMEIAAALETDTEVPDTATYNAGLTYKAVSYYRWTKSSLNLRKGPSAGYSKLASIPAGTKLKVTRVASNGWSRVSYGGKTGYVSGTYLSKTEILPATKASASAGSSYSPNRMYIAGKALVYKNGGKSSGQSIIDSNRNVISTWGGATPWSGNDGSNTHFIGHNDGAFRGIWNLAIGSTIIVTDGSGKPTTYRLTKKFIVTDSAVGVNDGQKYFSYITSTSGGEVITLQTCKTSTTNWILRAEKIN